MFQGCSDNVGLVVVCYCEVLDCFRIVSDGLLFCENPKITGGPGEISTSGAYVRNLEFKL